MRVALQGIGVVGGFGYGVDQLAKRLQTVGSRHGAKGGKINFKSVHHWTVDTEPLKQLVPPRQLRRIDHFSRMALMSAFGAIKDAETGGLIPERERAGVVLATGYGATRTTFGFLDSVIDDGDALASPIHFANSVHNAAAAHVAMLTGAKGPNLTIGQFDAPIGEGLLTACQMLQEKRAQTVLFGGVDEYCDILAYCHAKMGCQNRAVPIGEGAVFLLLGCEEGLHNSRIKPKYGWLTNVSKQPKVHMPDLLTVYSDIYGQMPIASGFDLAIAALSLNAAHIDAISRQAAPVHSGVVFNGRELSATVYIKDWGHFTISRVVKGSENP